MDKLVKFSDFVRLPLNCLKVLGLTPLQSETKSIKQKLLKFYNYVQIGNLVWFVLSGIIIVNPNVNDLEILIATIPMYGYTCIALSKSLSILIGAVEFRDLMTTLEDLFPRSSSEQKDFNVREYLKGYKIIERVLSAFTVYVMLKYIYLTCVALFTRTALKLPYETWVPFDRKNPNFFWLVIFVDFNTSIMLIFPFMGADLILYTSITLITMQFDILCYKLRRLTNDSMKRVSFKELVKLHETLLHSSESLNKIFSASIFVNFTSSSILICLVGYQISVGFNFTHLLRYIGILVGSLIQIAVVCYYGEKLSTASANVSEAAYDSGWNNCDNKAFKHGLQMMVRRSQNPSFITAYKFSKVSLQAFTVVSFLKASRF